MANQVVDVLIEGGKATAAPPLGPALGPTGVNIGQVVADINKKTEAFKGMQVPVKVIVDAAKKSYEISVGTPPASALIKKEAGLQKGSGKPKSELVADLKIEQIIKIAKMKRDSMLGANLKACVKEVIGTCRSAGVMVEGVPAGQAMKMVVEGEFDKEIKAEKTELSAEELKALAEERQRLQDELAKFHAELEAKAKAVMDGMAGAEKKAIRIKLAEAGIPDDMINKLVPVEKAAPAAGAAAKK